MAALAQHGLQAAQLAQMGIPAAAVNSFQDSSERNRVMEKAARGEYRLLYLSPERLAQEIRRVLAMSREVQVRARDAQGERLYDYLCRQARMAHPRVGTGRFGADMQVSLVNDGPVTIPMRIQ